MTLVGPYDQPLHNALLAHDMEELHGLMSNHSLNIPSVLQTLHVLHVYSISKVFITPLQAAVITGDYKLCKQLLAEKADLYSLSYYTPHPLPLALQHKKYQIAKLLIDSGANVFIKQFGIYPLYYAINKGSPDHIVDDIIKAGFPPGNDVNVNSSLKPLHIAVQHNNINIATLLLSTHKVNCNEKDSKGNTPLHFAVMFRCVDMIKLLAEYGADLDLENKEGLAPLFYAVRNNDINSVEMLLQFGAEIHCYSNKYMYPLNIAISLCNEEIVRFLILKGADVNKVCPSTKTLALHSAALCQKGKQSLTLLYCLINIIRVLTENGSKIEAPNKLGYTPLQLAIKEQNFKVAKVLVKEGSVVNAVFEENTNFHFIARFGCEEVVKTFLEFGADYYVRDKNYLTPYHFSFLNKGTCLLELFWRFNCPLDLNVIKDKPFKPDCKSDIIAKLNTQKMFLDGIRANDLNIICSALAEGAEIRGCCSEMLYPLHFAAQKGFDAIVVLMLDKGVPPNYVNNDGETPLHLAASEGHYNICLYLLQSGASYNIPSKVSKCKPLDLALKNNHSNIIGLIKNIDNMFKSKKEKVIIKKLETLSEDCQQDLLSAINCVDYRGDTLMSRALRKEFYTLAQFVMRLRLGIQESCL